jgi:hypothetical protein
MSYFKGQVKVMHNRLRRLSVLLLSATSAVCPLPLPSARAAENAYRTGDTTAVFAREVEADIAARWERGGSFVLRASASPVSPSPVNEVLYDHLARIHPRMEGLDVTLLYRLTDMVALYGGGWFLSALESGVPKPRAAKFGLDFASPWLLLDQMIQPIGAVEFKSRKDYDWSTDFSLRAGFRWNDTRAPGRSLSLMLEGFVGNSQSTVPGARQQIDYLGLGLHYVW